MALDPITGGQKIQEYSDPDYGGFISYVEDEPTAITLWQNVINAVFTAVVPVSTTVAAAVSAFATAASGMTDPTTGLAIFLSAWNASIVMIGGGMVGYNLVTPPPYYAGIEFSNILLSDPSTTPATAATTIASQIAVKATFWQSQLIAPPFTIVNWS